LPQKEYQAVMEREFEVVVIIKTKSMSNGMNKSKLIWGDCRGGAHFCWISVVSQLQGKKQTGSRFQNQRGNAVAVFS